MGITTIMVTGDNPLTARTIAEEAGVDDFLAEAKPEDKIRVIREQQADGRFDPIHSATEVHQPRRPAAGPADVAAQFGDQRRQFGHQLNSLKKPIILSPPIANRTTTNTT